MRNDECNLAAMKTYPLILLLRRPILLLDGMLKLRVGPVEEDLGALAGDQQALHLGPSRSLTLTLCPSSHSTLMVLERIDPKHLFKTSKNTYGWDFFFSS